MFKIGDKAVYPAHGVAEITGIESREISGSEEIFYVLRVLNTDRKIMVPLSKVQSVGLRKVITEEEIDEVYGVLKERPIRVSQKNWNRRYRKYLEKIKSGSVFHVAEVLRDLYLLRGSKPLSFGERKMLDTAKSLLVKELSIARNENESSIETELSGMFSETKEEISENLNN
jgi:CarD family transcriptional regulator